jgi:hypothetical protein
MKQYSCYLKTKESDFLQSLCNKVGKNNKDRLLEVTFEPDDFGRLEQPHTSEPICIYIGTHVPKAYEHMNNGFGSKHFGRF